MTTLNLATGWPDLGPIMQSLHRMVAAFMFILAYCFVWLYFSAVGGGPWILDAKLCLSTRW